MDLAAISRSTGVATRLLRYVVDHDVLPGGRVKGPGRGTARNYTEFEAFGIACAAILLDAGITRRTVSDLFERLTQKQALQGGRLGIPLLEAFSNAKTVTLELGDGLNYRLVASTSRGKPTERSKWVQSSTGAELEEGYEPLVHLIVNIGRVRSALRA